MRLPTISANSVELVSFDALGVVRYRLEMESGEDLETWEQCLLRRTRRRYPAQRIELMG
jgi:hypothetical protein